MAKKPNYFRKPASFHKTETGFMHSGEGMVTEYEKRNSIIGNKMNYFILLQNRKTETGFVERSTHLTAAQARNNIDVNDDFSPNFKHSLFKIIFETKKDAYVTNIKRFIRYL